MKITFKKPKYLPLKTNKNDIMQKLKRVKFFYDYSTFSKKYFPIKLKPLLVFLVFVSILTLGMFFLSSSLRSTDLDNREIFKQTFILNYTLWLAFLLFVIGLNGLIVLALRIRKIEVSLKPFFINQLFVGITMYTMMRSIATVIILVDEKLPFEINYNLRFFNFNLLTILFLSQILLVVIVYNYLKLNLGDKLSKHQLFETIISVLYIASIWTLTTP